MNILKHGDYEGTAEIDLERGICRGKLLFIDDLVTYEAETIIGLRESFLEAIDDYIETCQAIGKEPLRPYKGQFNVRVSPSLHKLAKRAQDKQVPMKEAVKPLVKRAMGKGRKGC